MTREGRAIDRTALVLSGREGAWARRRRSPAGSASTCSGLGICDELERRVHLVDTYRYEWKEVIDNPELRRKFRQLVNTDETGLGIEFVDERGQQRPEYWEKKVIPVEDVTRPAADGPSALRDSSGLTRCRRPARRPITKRGNVPGRPAATLDKTHRRVA